MNERPYRDQSWRGTRRQLLAGGLAALASGFGLRGAEVRPKRGLRIARIERTTVRLPFREVPARNMAREIPHWAWSEVCEVHLQSGHVGRGETLLYYTWGVTSDGAVRDALGKNAAEIMWDDGLGAGLQMAIFDAVARANDVPIHSLLGKQVHQKTPLAWWNIDTSPEDLVVECQEAHRQGYRAYKTKGRPWFDVWALAEAASRAVPPSFKVVLDFNDTLLTAERGIPILEELARYPQMKCWETPIFQTDIKGSQAIRKAAPIPVAMHYGRPPALVALREQICDGFIIGGGASRVLKRGHVAAMADMPFWLQLVGSDITAAWSLHFGAVLSHAIWPAVNCHQLFSHGLLTRPIEVKDGQAQVPDGPGLGYEVDPDVVARCRVDKPARRPDPPRLIETSWPDGRQMYMASNGEVNFMLRAAQAGKIPYFERGVTTRLLPDDGSARWKDLHARARRGPVMLRE